MVTATINPTRMELSKSKKKLMTAIKGHKLLKDKHDELVRQYILLKNKNDILQKNVSEKLKISDKYMKLAESVSEKEIIDVSLMIPNKQINLEIDKINVMGVLIPKFTAEYKKTDKADIFSYGFSFTSSYLDNAVSSVYDVLDELIELAETEKSCQLINAEIIKLRRRVNALEHVIIPEYKRIIRYIRMKLDENERGTITRLMKVKDMMIKERLS